MSRKKKPAHEFGAEWSQEEVKALLAKHITPVAAAAAAGVTRQRFQQVMLLFGLAAPERPLADPGAQPANAGRKNPLVTVALRPEHHTWIATQGPRMRSTVVQRGLDYLSATDRAAWLAAHEDPAVLSRAAAMAQDKA